MAPAMPRPAAGMAAGQPLCLQRAQDVAGQAFRRRHRGQGPGGDRAVAHQAQAPISWPFLLRASPGAPSGHRVAPGRARAVEGDPTWRILVTKLPKKPVIWVSQAR